MGLKKLLKKVFLKIFRLRRHQKVEPEAPFCEQRAEEFACKATVCEVTISPDSEDEDVMSYNSDLNATVTEASLNQSQFSEDGDSNGAETSGSEHHFLNPRASYVDRKGREQETQRDALRREDHRSKDLILRGMMVHLDEADEVNAKLHEILDAAAPAVLSSNADAPPSEYQSSKGTTLRLTRRPTTQHQKQSFDPAF
ncbi:hypothetical protein CAPTEDRAFT_203968 [Capitella teleta]|uniref:Uncharacterized protein n=1 Tax=Capitella teleta TaxID=283909 RepID=R7UUJ7_CAPTE|nr:hypothetical protein CAPTEDRAFT_203968 [Capitella teleta]|eukprot:ELU10313.1 hypothetical protein CAPTEDRAFT_203968 [Capitella teleta]